MQKILVAILLLITLLVVFILQNSSDVIITFWFWKINTNLSLAIILSLTVGAVISYLASIPGRKKRQLKIEKLSEENKIIKNSLLDKKPQDVSKMNNGKKEL